MFTKESIKQQLQTSVATVTFTKKDGDTRVMECTLLPELLPKRVNEDKTNKPQRKENPDVLAVYDTNAEGWRSFIVANVTDVS